MNISKASNAVRLCISDAEKKASISLKKINVVFEQPDFLCTKLSKHKKIDGSKIQRSDIEFLLVEGKKQLIYNDKNQYIIHIFNHNYIVDGKTFIEEPIDIYANSLSHEITFITAPKNNIKNINQIFINCDIEIERLISRTFALGSKFLNGKDLQLGSILINLEFESVSFGMFKNLALVNSITLPIGINHITKDISKVCSLNFNESEIIRNNIDFSFKNNLNIFDKSDYLKNIYFVNSNFRKISKKLVLDVIKARIDEMLNILKKQIIPTEFNLSPRMNFLLLGAGKQLINLDQYCATFFTLNQIKINKNNDIKDNNLNEKFAPSLGAIKIIEDGWETEAIAKEKGKNTSRKGIFSKIFGKR